MVDGAVSVPAVPFVSVSAVRPIVLVAAVRPIVLVSAVLLPEVTDVAVLLQTVSVDQAVSVAVALLLPAVAAATSAASDSVQIDCGLDLELKVC